MSKLKTLAADTSMMDRWKIISPGKKGKTKVTAEEGQPLVAAAIALANETKRAPNTHPRRSQPRLLALWRERRRHCSLGV